MSTHYGLISTFGIKRTLGIFVLIITGKREREIICNTTAEKY